MISSCLYPIRYTPLSINLETTRLNQEILVDQALDLEKASFCAFLSCLAYAPNSLIEESAKRLNMGVEFFENKNFAFAFYNDKEVYLSFRGTKNAMDFLSDGSAFMVRRPYGLVHNGFVDAFERLKPLIAKFKHFETTYGKPVLYGQDKSKTIYTTGHSLGAAMCALCAYWLGESTEWDIKVYTAGQPRVGNWRWKRNYNKLGLEHFRFVHGDDIVTKVPRLWFYHVGNPIYMNDKGEIIKRNPQGWKRFFMFPLIKGVADHLMFKNYFSNISGKLTNPFLNGLVQDICEVLKKL